jgi:site-specific DNA-methyltransferase (adenine-specific)
MAEPLRPYPYRPLEFAELDPPDERFIAHQRDWRENERLGDDNRLSIGQPGVSRIMDKALADRPYYQDDLVIIYHGDCRVLLPYVPVEVIVVTDPPYGIDHRTSSFWRGEKIAGDDQEFDPSHLLGFSGQVIFGANHFADKLPPSAGWIVWNKRDRVSRNLPGSDAELAWTGGGVLNQVRIFTHVWVPHTLRTEPAYHPTQKPVALMRKILECVGGGEDMILDPYMGSGSTLLAAKSNGQRAIGIEVEERYCEIAASRLAQDHLW